MKSRNLLTGQINSSPSPLRDYIHELESFAGNGAHMIQELFALRENIKYLEKLYLSDAGGKNKSC